MTNKHAICLGIYPMFRETHTYLYHEKICIWLIAFGFVTIITRTGQVTHVTEALQFVSRYLPVLQKLPLWWILPLWLSTIQHVRCKDHLTCLCEYIYIYIIYIYQYHHLGWVYLHFECLPSIKHGWIPHLVRRFTQPRWMTPFRVSHQYTHQIPLNPINSHIHNIYISIYIYMSNPRNNSHSWFTLW